MKNIQFLCFILSTLLLTIQCKQIKSQKTNLLQSAIFDTITRILDINYNVKQNGGNDLIFYDHTFYEIFDFCGDSTLKIVNLKNNELNILNYYDPNCGQVYASIKKDGIFVVSVDNVLYKYTGKNKERVKILDLMSIDSFKNSGLTAWWHKVSGNQHINIPENIIYFRLEKNADFENGKFSLVDSLYPIFAKLNMKTNSISFFGYKPNIGPGLMHSSFQIYMVDSIFVSYSYTDKIERINTISGETYIYRTKSSYDTVPIKTFEFDEATYTLQKNIKHALETANYGPLYYNPYNKHFYRIFHPYLPERNAQGEMNTDFDKESILMIMDQNFKIKKEVPLPVRWSKLSRVLYPVPNGIDFYMAPDHLTTKGDKTEFKYLRYIHD
jgi:hypothetical protein